MQVLFWTDERGRKHRSLVRDGDTDGRVGIPLDPPDVDELDWELIKTQLHNHFVEHGLYDWSDVQLKQDAISNTIRAVLKPPLVGLFKKRSKKTSGEL